MFLIGFVDSFSELLSSEYSTWTLSLDIKTQIVYLCKEHDIPVYYIEDWIYYFKGLYNILYIRYI